MEWRWNSLILIFAYGNECLNPCSNGMALELYFVVNYFMVMKKVLILVLMEWRWNIK